MNKKNIKKKKLYSKHVNQDLEKKIMQTNKIYILTWNFKIKHAFYSENIKSEIYICMNQRRQK